MELSNIPFTFIITWIFFAIIIAFIVYLFTSIPWYSRGGINSNEGFYAGVAGGSGQPDCSRMVPEFSKILELLNLATVKNCSEEDGDKYNELTLILGKLSCLKQDLVGAGGVVDATRHHPFTSSHDIEQISEVTATCLSQTISPRDLDIIFDKWIKRSVLLVQKLMVITGKSENDARKIEMLLAESLADVYDISRDKCIKVIHESPPSSDPAPRTPESLMELRQV